MLVPSHEVLFALGDYTSRILSRIWGFHELEQNGQNWSRFFWNISKIRQNTCKRTMFMTGRKQNVILLLFMFVLSCPRRGHFFKLFSWLNIVEHDHNVPRDSSVELVCRRLVVAVWRALETGVPNLMQTRTM